MVFLLDAVVNDIQNPLQEVAPACRLFTVFSHSVTSIVELCPTSFRADEPESTYGAKLIINSNIAVPSAVCFLVEDSVKQPLNILFRLFLEVP